MGEAIIMRRKDTWVGQPQNDEEKPESGTLHKVAWSASFMHSGIRGTGVTGRGTGGPELSPEVSLSGDILMALGTIVQE